MDDFSTNRAPDQDALAVSLLPVLLLRL